MNVEVLKKNHDQVIDCEVKDETGLNDFQKLPNQHNIAIPKVGIERFRIPMVFELADGETRSHDCEASMYVFLESHKTGVNMSRFCKILQDEAGEKTVNNQFIKTILRRYRTDLRDSDTDPLIPKAFFGLKFSYPVKQKSLKSRNWGWQYYDTHLEGIETDQGELSLKITLDYEYSSTCPCSLSMAKQYERDFREGVTTEGQGTASAHSQRSLARVSTTVSLDSDFGIEDLLKLLRMALPTETQSLVKRLDEQAFAILNGEYPMFVEHATRRLSTVLNSDDRILDWSAKVEHFESLHSHNAVAEIFKA